MTTDTRPLPRLRSGSRFAFVRDLAMVAVCIGIVASFLVDVWKAAPRTGSRAAASVAGVHQIA